MFLEISGS